MREPPSPCRLSVLPATQAPLAVVLRRGPSDWARLSLWHTDSDTFEHGQWFRGRVYERRCDLSSDGSLFVYFTRKTPSPDRPEQRADSWIAISRPPWFTALALWFVGGTYHTGGLFPSHDSVYIGFSDPPDQGKLPPWLSLAETLPYIDRTPDWTSRTIFFSRLLRAGWTPMQGLDATAEPAWQRREPDGDFSLIMTPDATAGFTEYGGRHVTEYAVREERTGSVIDLGRATWCDWDRAGRLLIAQDGRLLECDPQSGTLREIADFNPMSPDPAPAPAIARQWPRRPA